MTIAVNSAKALEILNEAFERAKTDSYQVSECVETLIAEIIGHTHLTYKYILLNGLLAKSTNPEANPLTLQAGSPLEGAFDARSLCHAIVVPFEQNVLEKRLGGSNEPFLNKPARFPHLSTENAVRRGKDRTTLERLIRLFELVNSDGDAVEPLVAVLAHILKLKSRVVIFDGERLPDLASKRALSSFFERITAKSCEGESLALSIALLFDLLSKSQSNNLNVVSHPANQAGSSSNQISDVDVFNVDGKSLIYCCEAKDKPFGRADIDHAIAKVAEASHPSMLFVYGPNASTTENLDDIVAEYEEKGFDLSCLNFPDFARSIIFLCSRVTWEEVGNLLNKHLGLMRAKVSTIEHCQGAMNA